MISILNNWFSILILCIINATSEAAAEKRK
nr:MAG TPA: hypothetical protein [Caudoviricetes sp.]